MYLQMFGRGGLSFDLDLHDGAATFAAGTALKAAYASGGEDAVRDMVVTLTADSTVDFGNSGDPLFGKVVKYETDGYVGVQFIGMTELPTNATTPPTAGQPLAVDGAGKVIANTLNEGGPVAVDIETGYVSCYLNGYGSFEGTVVLTAGTNAKADGAASVGKAVALTAASTADYGSSGDPLLGKVVQYLTGDKVRVRIRGVVTLPADGTTPPAALEILAVNGTGGVLKHATNVVGKTTIAVAGGVVTALLG